MWQYMPFYSLYITNKTEHFKSVSFMQVASNEIHHQLQGNAILGVNIAAKVVLATLHYYQDGAR